MGRSLGWKPCPVFFSYRSASGQGKTTIHRRACPPASAHGRRVRVFKCGPDFLDPQILAAASGAPSYNLDCGCAAKRSAARGFIRPQAKRMSFFVEGVMGLYDGFSFHQPPISPGFRIAISLHRPAPTAPCQSTWITGPSK